MYRKGLSEDKLRNVLVQSDVSDFSQPDSKFYDSDTDPVYDENVPSSS